jgi:RHH-type proline utilization regulon transcriptional repressor/proline dehydrogenase/delta 1-pyrroline-5-carboxylate dehydrogenase
MAEGIYREVLASHPDLALRVYAPVGEHRDLLAYLVRRLLENGANSSFVHQLSDAQVSVDELLRSPLHAADDAGQPAPSHLYGDARANSTGADLSVPEQRVPLLQAVALARVPAVPPASTEAVQQAMAALDGGFAAWSTRPRGGQDDGGLHRRGPRGR